MMMSESFYSSHFTCQVHRWPLRVFDLISSLAFFPLFCSVWTNTFFHFDSNNKMDVWRVAPTQPFSTAANRFAFFSPFLINCARIVPWLLIPRNQRQNRQWQWPSVNMLNGYVIILRDVFRRNGGKKGNKNDEDGDGGGFFADPLPALIPEVHSAHEIREHTVFCWMGSRMCYNVYPRLPIDFARISLQKLFVSVIWTIYFYSREKEFNESYTHTHTHTFICLKLLKHSEYRSR